MSMIFIATGRATLGMNKMDKDGNVTESTPGQFFFTDTGPCVAVGEMDPETMEVKEDSVSLYGDWDAAGYLEKALDKLKPYRKTNIPDFKAITRALWKENIDLCEYCHDQNCSDCVVRQWGEEETP